MNERGRYQKENISLQAKKPFSPALHNEFIEIAKPLQDGACCTAFTAINLWIMLEWTY